MSDVLTSACWQIIKLIKKRKERMSDRIYSEKHTRAAVEEVSEEARRMERM